MEVGGNTKYDRPPLRLVSYNIRGCRGLDDRRDIARVAAVIKEAAPDIVCLQEVHQRLPWSGFTDQPRRLAKLIGMRVVFHRTINMGIAGYGIAIATRLPIGRIRRRRLPGRGEPRGCLEVALQTPGGVVTVVCTHLGLTAEARLLQSTRIAERCSAIDGPLLLAGDFNERPDGPALGPIIGGARLCDAAPCGLPTYPADAPRARIDYVFHSPQILIRDVRAPATLASDHLPVIVDWVLSEP